MRKIAKALYNRAEEEEQRDARTFFQSLDLNRDKKISLAELKGGVESRIVGSRIANQRVFKELGSNRDGTLNFHDVLVLFYYNKKAITILRCGACEQLIFGPSFSCFECLRNHPERHFLCCDCYSEGKSIRHNHPSSSSMPTQFSHDQDLLVKFTKLTPQVINNYNLSIHGLKYGLFVDS